MARKDINTNGLEVKTHTPMRPNFIRTTDGKTIDIADISDEELSKIADRWKAELIAHAQKRRAAR